MFDDFVERGGNAFDTAYVYRSGQSERLLGQWVGSRGVRDEVYVLDKGAHTPNCYPAAMRRELCESLDRLQMDSVDLYLLHRDNPDVPAGEFIDALNDEKRAGRIGAFGASNWGLERLKAAQQYARENGLEGFSAVSNNFSLAEMIEPVWEGCLSAREPDFARWLEESGLPLVAWSSQARGFFTDRSGPEKRDDPELVRCWYSEENFERKRRAEELARKKGVLPINVALAFVLAQPFAAFAVIGPRTLYETHTSLPALDVELTGDELAWLDLRE